MSLIDDDIRFKACLAETLKWEGRYCIDDGGPTMEGITQSEYNEWLTAHGAPHAPVRAICDSDLHAIYYNEYWVKADCASYPPGLDLCVFDAAVNAGVSRGVRFAIATNAIVDVVARIESYQELRLAKYQSWPRLWRVYGVGWSRRIEGIREVAKAMVAALHPTVA